MVILISDKEKLHTIGELTDDQRKEVVQTLKERCCIYCGHLFTKDDKICHCNNDE